MPQHVKITSRPFPVTFTVTSAEDSFDFSGPFWAAADIIVRVDGVALEVRVVLALAVFLCHSGQYDCFQRVGRVHGQVAEAANDSLYLPQQCAVVLNLELLSACDSVHSLLLGLGQ